MNAAITSRKVNTARILETGYILGALTLLLTLTGLLLSPSVSSALRFSAVQAGWGNALVATHMASAALLVAFLLWHLWPYAYAFSKKAGQAFLPYVASYSLLFLSLVQVFSGYVLWFHDYRILPKATAVFVHLAATFVLLVPFAFHATRGIRTTLKRRAAVATMLTAAAANDRLPQAMATREGVTRRMYLRVTGYTAAGLALAFAIGRSITDQILGWRLNSVGATPQISKDEWRLKVTGLVNRPVELSFAQLLAMGPRTQKFTHHCVEGWSYTDTFTGVPLQRVLELAGGIRPGAKQLILKSAETASRGPLSGQHYTTNFPVEDGLHDDVLLVYQVGNQDLPAIHGGPVRMMTPRKWGYKACKWLVEIQVSPDAAYRGYWEHFGYHNDGDYPGPIFG